MEPGLDYAPVAAPAKPARARTTRTDAMSDFLSPKVTPAAVTAAFVTQAMAADPVRMDWLKEEEFNDLEPARLTMPTMILQGSRDPGMPADVTARFFQKIAASQRQWTMLPGGDHVAQIEDTHAAFISAVVEFVTRPGSGK
jgi:pimeloyl-ACP methyl ester carboxylesterase